MIDSPRSNLATSPVEKPKIDIYDYFVGVGEFGKDSRRPSEPPVPNTIGAARKASLAKDIDPTVLKVKNSFQYDIFLKRKIGSRMDRR